jgi:hypothetical protein
MTINHGLWGPGGNKEGTGGKMTEAFLVNGSLAIDVLPSVDDEGQPALCLHTRGEPQQSIVISLSDIYVLRDVLAQAGAQLVREEAVNRKHRKIATHTGAVGVCGLS